MRKSILFGLCSALAVAASAQVTDYQPLEHAPYSASATVAPEAVKVFSGTYIGSGQTLEAQANDAFDQLAKDLQQVGASLNQVVNVRGYLRVEPDDSQMETVMQGWNAAFNQHFGSREVPPTRTTIGVTMLADGQAKLALDAVIALEPDQWPDGATRLSNERVQDLTPHLTAVKPFTALALTSGVLGDPGPEGQMGNMEAQASSALDKLADALAHWGASPRDVVFARALLSPPVPEEGEAAEPVDFKGFDAAWTRYWQDRRMAPPALSTLAAPGFNSSGRLIEIELYAALPNAAEAGTGVKREGSDTSFLSRSSLVGREAALTWFSGVVDTTREDHHGQGATALITLSERMADAGVEPEGVVQLRAYLEIEDFGPEFGQWNKAYGRFFNHPNLNPTKPVRTAFPVEASPGKSLLEIELIGVSDWK
ncbi:MAG: hypothetical protein E1N59_3344 [Puniceicoccaceae bacterium 5H]|nr:MAG: hypothetical protein E1N59_3344 [Puniceicoccaceae bacterium 5H]